MPAIRLAPTSQVAGGGIWPCSLARLFHSFMAFTSFSSVSNTSGKLSSAEVIPDRSPGLRPLCRQ
jgi:hypothetical protein